MKIDISDREQKRFEIDTVLKAGDWPFDKEELGKPGDDGIRVQGLLRRLPDENFVIEFTLSGILIYPCSRCLDPVPVPVVYEFSDDGIENGTDQLDLLPYIEDCLFINEPTKVLCSEDCKGLCQSCGANLNHETCSCEDEAAIDPRMEALKALL